MPACESEHECFRFLERGVGAAIVLGGCELGGVTRSVLVDNIGASGAAARSGAARASSSLVRCFVACFKGEVLPCLAEEGSVTGMGGFRSARSRRWGQGRTTPPHKGGRLCLSAHKDRCP